MTEFLHKKRKGKRKVVLFINSRKKRNEKPIFLIKSFFLDEAVEKVSFKYKEMSRSFFKLRLDDFFDIFEKKI